MAIKGTPKEQKVYNKYVGLFNANVVTVNPTKEELGKLLGMTIDKDPEYTGSNDDTGAKRVTLSFWLKEEKDGNYFNVRFNIEDTVVESKSGKTQFINSIGNTSYAEDKSQIPSFITENGRTVRPAKKGEELLYKFLRAWLNSLSYDDPSVELTLDTPIKNLVNGDVKELRAVIANYDKETVAALATVRTSSEGKEYQGVYSYEFLPSYAMRDYVSGKKQWKTVDRFIEKVTDAEYGCKDYYQLKALSEYNPANNVIQNTNSPIVKNTTNSVAEPQMAMTNDDLPF